ncbi:MAG TPA: diaminopimelate decarboxylase [Ignavibacteria bacterium]|nr:diaminopimelate decarboxylase [Ignavibacteria bacterium]
MIYFDSNYFTYRKDKLFCEEIDVEDIINTTGSPVYIYSKKFLKDHYHEFDNAFKEIAHSIFFAIKSNFNLNIVKLFAQMNSGIDVNSDGELYRALKVGVNPDRIIFSGVGKTQNEIELAIKIGLLMIKAESEEEIHLIDKTAASMNKIAPVAIRVNPDVDVQTHPYISTGLSENKFGVDADTAMKIYYEFKRFKHIKFVGIDMHIGSQITKIEPFVEAAEKLSKLYFQLKSKGIKLEHFDMGGGIGVVYKNEKTFRIKEFAGALIPLFKKLDCNIFFEPGRFLTANGGILATKVLYTKKNHGKNFIVVDASMSELLRPSIYRAYHHIQPINKKINVDEFITDIVGPVCESGDFLAKDREFVKCVQGEVLAVMSAGAYGMVMASNYNSRRRPPEVLVDRNSFKIIRNRETFDYLIFDELNKLTM